MTMTQRQHPINGTPTISSLIVPENGLTVRCTWVKGFDPELGFGQDCWGMTGRETPFWQLVPNVAATFEVIEHSDPAA
jgi:hypothetical protein